MGTGMDKATALLIKNELEGLHDQIRQWKDKHDTLKASHDKLVEACELFMEVKDLRNKMWQCIEKREGGLVGIQVMNDELAKVYQRLYRERQILKQTVCPKIEQALKEAEKL